MAAQRGTPQQRSLERRSISAAIITVLKEIVLEELEELDDETRAELEAMFGIGGRDEK